MGIQSVRRSNGSAFRCEVSVLAREIGRAVAHWNRGAGLAVAVGGFSLVAVAGPQGGNVVAGQAAIHSAGPLTTITQTTDRAVIDWRSFNVAAHETVRFQQPGREAATLNRVLGSDPSHILGRLEASGQVLLINPNGILFGRSARVDVASLVATTADLSNADFMAGRLAFNKPGRPGASVINDGSITVAEGGLAALVGPHVANRGVIHARLGQVVLAAGPAFTLDIGGDKLIQLAVEREDLDGISDAVGRPLSALLDQSGSIQADGGHVLLTAGTVSKLLDGLIRISGDIRATGFDTSPGRISLIGSSNSRLSLAGSVDASGTYGGRIEVTAGHVTLEESARVSATGRDGGGSVSIGGDWQGVGGLATAGSVDLLAGARIDASAHERGQGGTVVVWSDGDTRFEGLILSQGGVAGGDGGMVEVSGKQRLGFDGDVDASAARGAAGMLLLDPTNLVVDGSTGQNSLPGSGPGDFVVRAAAINRQLQRGTSVTLQADNDITINAGAQVDGRAAGGGVVGGGLSLQAGRDVVVRGVVVLNDGALGVQAGRDFIQGATNTNQLSLIATGSGNVSVVAGRSVDVQTLVASGEVQLTGQQGSVTVSNVLSGGAAGRVASLRAVGQTGVSLAGALVGGRTELESAAGAVGSGATIDSGGVVQVSGASVDLGAIVTPAAVSVTSAGMVKLGAVAGAAGPVADNTARAASLTIQSDGAVTLAGASLGTGSLVVQGRAVDGRAASLSFGDASIFSAGGITANTTGDITLQAAGLKAAGAIALNSASGAISTGAGRLDGAAALTLTAGTTLTLGSGGLVSAGNEAVGLTATGQLTLDGVITANSSPVTLTSNGADIRVNSDITASSLTATAEAGRYDQAPSDSVVKVDAATLKGRDGVEVGDLIATGRVELESRQGSVVVGKVLSGGESARVDSLSVIGQTGVSLAGALVSGLTELEAAEGEVSSTATLDSGGEVKVSGASVDLGAIVTPAAVRVSSAGMVKLGAVAGAAGEVTDNTAPAALLKVNADGAVTLAGASLGTDGLLVQGRATDGRVASLSFGDASVFSAGDIRASTSGNITLQKAGMQAGGAINLNSAGGAISTGAGRLEGAAAMTLTAGTTLTLGGGGLVGSGGAAVALTAAEQLTLSGVITAAQAPVTLSSTTANIGVNSDIVAASLTATAAAGRYQQANSGSVVKVGAATLKGRDGVEVGDLIATGRVELESQQGNVTARKVLSGGESARVASLSAKGQTGVSLAGALVGGLTELESTAGAVTSSATVDSAGAVQVTGASVNLGAIVTPAAVTVTSAGAVQLGAVAGAAGEVTDNTAPAASLRVNADGAVMLAGASLGTDGLVVQGRAADGRVASLSLGDASVFSAGGITARTTGDITLQAAGLKAAGAIALSSANGAIETGAGKIEAAGADLQARAGLIVGVGGVQVQGALSLQKAGAAGNIEALGQLQTNGGVITVDAVDGRVTLNDVVTWAGADSSGALVVRGGDVVFSRGLGGENTGYTLSELGYQPHLRPLVGRVTVTAMRNIEFNGLNIDGNTGPDDFAPGLNVRAGERIFSNSLIAVNKGAIDIRLSNATPSLEQMHGIYLGNSVYSRGLDRDGSAERKVTFPIVIGGTTSTGAPHLFLFDNTNDFALVLASLDAEVPSQVAKIVVANNVANYRTEDGAEDPLLVLSGQPASVTIAASGLNGLRHVGPIRVDARPSRQDLVARLSEAASTVFDSSQPEGVGERSSGITLKVQVYPALGDVRDLSTSVQEITANGDFNGNSAPSYESLGIKDIYGVVYDIELANQAIIDRLKDDRDFVLSEEDLSNPEFKSFNFDTIVLGSLSSVRAQSGTTIGYAVDEPGRVSGFIDRIAGSSQGVRVLIESATPTLVDGSWQSGGSESNFRYGLYGRIVQTDDSSRTQVLFSGSEDGRRGSPLGIYLETLRATATFNTSGVVNSVVDGSVIGGTFGAGGTSNVGFAPVGGFGSKPSVVLPSASGNLGLPTLQPGAQTPGSTGLPILGNANDPTALAGGFGSGSGDGVTPLNPQIPGPPVEPGISDDSTTRLPTDGVVVPEGPGTLSDESGSEPVILGRRVASDADLGQGGSAGGATRNTLRARYRLARVVDASVCAPETFDNRSTRTGTGEERACVAPAE